MRNMINKERNTEGAGYRGSTIGEAERATASSLHYDRCPCRTMRRAKEKGGCADGVASGIIDGRSALTCGSGGPSAGDSQRRQSAGD